ncbi:uncharacterized protein MONOS_6470 [Monocercomonoides exilis]|uniref:uncharacterized protein n=1 Tax=Monocercomonoides exilis TaxID=2049356 RepID=UPI003559DC31|nr:hypothetical protein MONOS_6470 [Monocercomonoides exilis]|eukprot:MONOS_6470.1-p1 / transcript=MONOS_6470.1 / gene=MONOS_6470 / organism=Monocercomonoides_exilis_PA203 / gene_product=unspecified product / transcript_product=unspecified product / location=Mono_scaffold00204:8496-12175(+) / protein_length=1107 / sequence_SO=supercontig / SO=protein_coding / is_pseudo=false
MSVISSPLGTNKQYAIPEEPESFSHQGKLLSQNLKSYTSPVQNGREQDGKTKDAIMKSFLNFKMKFDDQCKNSKSISIDEAVAIQKMELLKMKGAKSLRQKKTTSFLSPERPSLFPTEEKVSKEVPNVGHYHPQYGAIDSEKFTRRAVVAEGAQQENHQNRIALSSRLSSTRDRTQVLENISPSKRPDSVNTFRSRTFQPLSTSASTTRSTSPAMQMSSFFRSTSPARPKRGGIAPVPSECQTEFYITHDTSEAGLQGAQVGKVLPISNLGREEANIKKEDVSVDRIYEVNGPQQWGIGSSLTGVGGGGGGVIDLSRTTSRDGHKVEPVRSPSRKSRMGGKGIHLPLAGISSSSSPSSSSSSSSPLTSTLSSTGVVLKDGTLLTMRSVSEMRERKRSSRSATSMALTRTGGTSAAGGGGGEGCDAIYKYDLSLLSSKKQNKTIADLSRTLATPRLSWRIVPKVEVWNTPSEARFNADEAERAVRTSPKGAVDFEKSKGTMTTDLLSPALPTGKLRSMVLKLKQMQTQKQKQKQRESEEGSGMSEETEEAAKERSMRMIRERAEEEERQAREMSTEVLDHLSGRSRTLCGVDFSAMSGRRSAEEPLTNDLDYCPDQTVGLVMYKDEPVHKTFTASASFPPLGETSHSSCAANAAYDTSDSACTTRGVITERGLSTFRSGNANASASASFSASSSASSTPRRSHPQVALSESLRREYSRIAEHQQLLITSRSASPQSTDRLAASSSPSSSTPRSATAVAPTASGTASPSLSDNSPFSSPALSPRSASVSPISSPLATSRFDPAASPPAVRRAASSSFTRHPSSLRSTFSPSQSPSLSSSPFPSGTPRSRSEGVAQETESSGLKTAAGDELPLSLTASTFVSGSSSSDFTLVSSGMRQHVKTVPFWSTPSREEDDPNRWFDKPADVFYHPEKADSLTFKQIGSIGQNEFAAQLPRSAVSVSHAPGAAFFMAQGNGATSSTSSSSSSSSSSLPSGVNAGGSFADGKLGQKDMSYSSQLPTTAFHSFSKSYGGAGKEVGGIRKNKQGNGRKDKSLSGVTGTVPGSMDVFYDVKMKAVEKHVPAADFSSTGAGAKNGTTDRMKRLALKRGQF